MSHLPYLPSPLLSSCLIRSDPIWSCLIVFNPSILTLLCVPLPNYPHSCFSSSTIIFPPITFPTLPSLPIPTPTAPSYDSLPFPSQNCTTHNSPPLPNFLSLLKFDSPSMLPLPPIPNYPYFPSRPLLSVPSPHFPYREKSTSDGQPTQSFYLGIRKPKNEGK